MENKSKRRRIIIALMLLLIIGAVVALVFILPRFKDQKNVVANIEVQGIKVQGNTLYPLVTEYTQFAADDESSVKYVAELESIDLTYDSYMMYQYAIDNMGTDIVLFELSVNTLENYNCNIAYAVENLATSYPYTEPIVGIVSSGGRVIISISISINDIANDAVFKGNIGLNLSVV